MLQSLLINNDLIPSTNDLLHQQTNYNYPVIMTYPILILVDKVIPFVFVTEIFIEILVIMVFLMELLIMYWVIN